MFNFLRFGRRAPAELCFHTDIHCHVIPGVDDGAPDAPTGAALVAAMRDMGIGRIIASPHVTYSSFENDTATLAPALAELRTELAAQGIDVPVSHAAEYRLDELFLKRFESDDLMLLPNGHILIENSFIQEPWKLDEIIFDLRRKGLVPILAHPERYSYYQWNPRRYGELRQAGACLQINLLSLAGAYSKAERATALHLIKNGMVDFIGTDIHNFRHIDCIRRYLTTGNAASEMKTLRGMVRNDTAFL